MVLEATASFTPSFRSWQTCCVPDVCPRSSASGAPSKVGLIPGRFFGGASCRDSVPRRGRSLVPFVVAARYPTCSKLSRLRGCPRDIWPRRQNGLGENRFENFERAGDRPT